MIRGPALAKAMEDNRDVGLVLRRHKGTSRQPGRRERTLKRQPFSFRHAKAKIGRCTGNAISQASRHEKSPGGRPYARALQGFWTQAAGSTRRSEFIPQSITNDRATLPRFIVSRRQAAANGAGGVGPQMAPELVALGSKICKLLSGVVRPIGLEPITFGSGARRTRHPMTVHDRAWWGAESRIALRLRA